MKLILFDIDGTLIKRGNRHQRQSYSYAIRQVLDIEGYLDDIVADGKVDSQIFLEILSYRSIPEERAREHLSRLFSARYQYLVQNMVEVQPGDVLPGVTRLLSTLEGGFILGILTGNEERSAWHRLEKAGLKDFFSMGAFGNDAELRADLVKIAIERAEKMTHQRISPGETLIVGDTPNDVLCAKENNVPVLAVETGRFASKALRETGADFVLADLSHISEFQKFIHQLEGRPA